MRKGKKAMLMAGAIMASSAVLGTGVLAADGDTFTISTKAGDTHAYDVYQIFTGDLGSDQQTLSNIQAGANFKGDADGVQAALNDLIDTSTDTDVEKLAIIEKYVDLSTAAVASVTADTPAEGLAPGYYLVKDQDTGSVGDYDSYTLYIVKVAGNVEVRRKSAVPTMTKSVKEVNDSTGVTTDWQAYADFDKGDTIAYQLAGTLPDNYDQYGTYAHRFSDTISRGLTLNADSVEVKAGATTLEKDVDYQMSTSEGENGTTLEISFVDLKQVAAVTADSVITVDYQATLTTDAQIGATGNTNTAYLEFSNDPNTDGKTTVTPEQSVNVYTYQVMIGNKDKSGKELDGAEFALMKKVGSNWIEVKQTKQDSDVATEAEEGANGTTGANGETGNGENGEAGSGNGETGNSGAESTDKVFVWDGIDAGTYKLTQTKTPNKYNTIKDIEFTVSSTYKDGTLSALEAKTEGGAELKDALAADAQTGIISGEVISTKGTVLPTTGTRGIIFLLGGIIVILGGAGVIRMQSKKEKDQD